MTLGLVEYCALPTYSGQENANLHLDSPNPASQIPGLRINSSMKLTLKKTLSEVTALATAAGALRAARFLKMCRLPFPFTPPDAPTAAAA